MLITGGTGYVGTAVKNALLSQGHEVIILSRTDKASSTRGVSYAIWDPAKNFIDENAIRNADAVIHLAGAGVAEKRWTAKRKKEIVDSRVRSGETLVAAIATIPNQIDTVISASAIGWYGPDGNPPVPFTEDKPFSNNFLGNTCYQWENAVLPVTDAGKRLVIFRIGIVLGKEGGAYPQMTLPLKFRTAAYFGNGKQVMSWIHQQDLVSLFLFALDHPEMQGVYNAVASEPVSNKDFINKVAKEKGGIFLPVPVPATALKIGLGEMSVELLKSATVSNQKVLNAGFRFEFPDMNTAVKDLEAR